MCENKAKLRERTQKALVHHSTEEVEERGSESERKQRKEKRLCDTKTLSPFF